MINIYNAIILVTGRAHCSIVCISMPSTRKGSHEKARRLMDENSVSLQMFLILLSFITLGSESQVSVLKQCQSNT